MGQYEKILCYFSMSSSSTHLSGPLYLQPLQPFLFSERTIHTLSETSCFSPSHKELCT